MSLAQEAIDNTTTTATRNVLASPLRYAGMPADRLWQFEDGAVNLGKLDVQQHDLARLCFVEFAMVYGNDWFVLPKPSTIEFTRERRSRNDKRQPADG